MLPSTVCARPPRTAAAAPTAFASPSQKPPARSLPLPAAAAAVGGALPAWLAAGKALAPEEPAPDVRSCAHAAGCSHGPAACQAAWRGDGERRAARRRVTSPHVAGPWGQQLLCASPRVSPCLVLSKASQWDSQYFLWQRSFQPNYLALTSLLFV